MTAVWSGLLAALVMVAGSTGPQRPASVRDFPVCAGFTPLEAARLADGVVLARTLPSSGGHDLAIAGAVRMAVPASFYAERFEDIASFKPGGPVLQAGRFSEVPRLEDLEPLAIAAGDVSDLRRCRATDCGIKLRATAIDRFRTEVDWRGQDHARHATRIMKEILYEDALAYRRGGGPALGAYSDKDEAVSRPAGLRSVLDASPCLRTTAPELFGYLAHYPSRVLPGSSSFLYWSKEDFGLKPVISLTHAVIHQPEPDGPIVIASLGLYSSHYAEASLGLTVLIEGISGGTPYTDVYYVNRTRIDTLRGSFAGLARSIISGRQRSGITRELQALKVRVESQWRAAGSPQR